MAENNSTLESINIDAMCLDLNETYSIGNTSISEACAALEVVPPPSPPLGGMQLVMFLGLFCMMISSFDLYFSMNLGKDVKGKAKTLKFMFIGVIVLYICELFLTLGTVIQALCPVALWLLGFCHYGIKVIVSYSYCMRVDLVLKSKKSYTNTSVQRILAILKYGIIVTLIFNIIKVLLFYKSERMADGSCKYDIAGFWGFVDEIMFGTIDALTLAFLIWFYKSEALTGKGALTIYRIIFMSSITLLATVVAVLVNVYVPSVGLVSSIADITTDILSMMRIFTRPSIEKNVDFENAKSRKSKVSKTSIAPSSAQSSAVGSKREA